MSSAYLAVLVAVGAVAFVLLLVALRGAVLAVANRLRRVFAIPELHRVLIAWAFLFLAAYQWTMAATGTVSLDQVGAADLFRALLLGGSLLFSSTWLISHGAPALRHLTARPVLWFFLFGLWCSLTLLWTTSVSATAYKTIEYLATLVLVAVAVFAISEFVPATKRTLALKRLFDWQWTLFTLCMVGIFAGVVLWPERALSPGQSWVPFQVRGVFPSISANSVGELGALLGLVCVNRILSRTAAALPYLFVGLGATLLMLFAQSRSAIIGFALGLLVLLVHYRAWRWFSWLAAAGVVVVSSQVLEQITAYLVRGRPTTIVTLTGRTKWWGAAVDSMQDRLLEGYGAFMGGKHVLSSTFDIGTSTLHNSYIEAWAGTGTIGAVMFVIAVIVMGDLLVRARPRSPRIPLRTLLWGESAAVFALLLVRSIFSVAFLWPPMITSAIILVYLTVQPESGAAPSPSRPQAVDYSLSQADKSRPMSP